MLTSNPRGDKYCQDSSWEGGRLRAREVSARWVLRRLASEIEFLQVRPWNFQPGEIFERPVLGIERANQRQVVPRPIQASWPPQRGPGDAVFNLVWESGVGRGGAEPQPPIEGVVLALPDEQSVRQCLAVVQHQS